MNVHIRNCNSIPLALSTWFTGSYQRIFFLVKLFSLLCLENLMASMKEPGACPSLTQWCSHSFITFYGPTVPKVVTAVLSGLSPNFELFRALSFFFGFPSMIEFCL